MSKETANSLDTCRDLELLNHLYLGLVDFDAFGGHYMAQDNSRLDHEVTLLPIQNQMDFLASLQNLAQICQAGIKACTIHREIIHENLDLALNEI